MFDVQMVDNHSSKSTIFRLKFHHDVRVHVERVEMEQVFAIKILFVVLEL